MPGAAWNTWRGAGLGLPQPRKHPKGHPKNSPTPQKSRISAAVCTALDAGAQRWPEQGQVAQAEGLEHPGGTEWLEEGQSSPGTPWQVLPCSLQAAASPTLCLFLNRGFHFKAIFFFCPCEIESKNTGKNYIYVNENFCKINRKSLGCFLEASVSIF